MPTRGIRGATTVAEDEPDLILQATRELLEAIMKENAGHDARRCRQCHLHRDGRSRRHLPRAGCPSNGLEHGSDDVCPRDPRAWQFAQSYPCACPLEYGNTAK